MDLQTALELMTAERNALRVALEGRKTITRTEFEALPHPDRAAHVRAGGKIIDDPK